MKKFLYSVVCWSIGAMVALIGVQVWYYFWTGHSLPMAFAMAISDCCKVVWTIGNNLWYWVLYILIPWMKGLSG